VVTGEKKADVVEHSVRYSTTSAYSSTGPPDKERRAIRPVSDCGSYCWESGQRFLILLEGKQASPFPYHTPVASFFSFRPCLIMASEIR
jgi:hypothetical protein